MILKLEKRDGRLIFLNSSHVIMVEEFPSRWEITIDAIVLAPIGAPSSGVRSTVATVNKVLDLDSVGAAPLVVHLDDCARNRSNP